MQDVLKYGNRVEYCGNWNVYEVIHRDDTYAVLKCVEFIREEEITNGSVCSRIDQEFWVPLRASHLFKLEWS